MIATVTQREDLEFLVSHARKGLPRVLEFRLDNLLPYLGEVEKVLAVLPEVTCLMTVRHGAEGGVGNLDDELRGQMYRRFLPFSDLIDVEVRTLIDGGLKDVISLAKKRGTQIVASFHNFETFPPIHQLKDVVETGFQDGGDIVKIAVHIERFSDLGDLTALLEEERGRGRAVSAMGMGPLGKLSRLVLAKAGSCLNYGYLQQPNAPGQWSAQRFGELLAELD